LRTNISRFSLSLVDVVLVVDGVPTEKYVNLLSIDKKVVSRSRAGLKCETRNR
jgi:hypothetical protein